MLKKLGNWIKAFILKRASSGHMIDIVEVRTKEIGLTGVRTETDIKIKNTFFLPITILSIKTDLLNKDGIKVGRMKYEHPKRINAKSEEIFTTISEVSIITSVFQAISTLLSQNISMQSVGSAQVKFLWWVVEVPVNDFFEIHPDKLKIVKDETDDERLLRLQRETERRERLEQIREKRKDSRAELKEEILKRKYGEEYIPKEERGKVKQDGQSEDTEPLPELVLEITNEINGVDVVLSENAAEQVPEEDKIIPSEEDEVIQKEE